MRTSTAKRILAGMLVTLTVQTTSLKAAEYFLRTGTTTLTLPNGSNVVMWGFAKDSAFGVMDGTVTVPGPVLTVLPGDSTLTIHLDNRLPEPVSIVIPGQSIVPSPVRMGNGRARSFTTETPTSNGVPVNYVWSNLRPGTFLYESGTHPSVQIQMGLYGCVRKDYAAGQTYSNVNFDAEVTLLYSEVDTALHKAVAEEDYGPGMSVSSTVGYAPKYFLINGQFYTNGLAPALTGNFGDAVMIHFLNAGLETHVPIVNNAYLKLIAEDGFQYSHPKQQYSVFLPAGKTIDAIFTATENGRFAVYDRRLYMVNADVSPGGMLTYLDVAVSSTNLILPANGGVLRSYTSQNGSGTGAAKLTDNAMGAAGYWRSGNTKHPQAFVYSFRNNSFAVLTHAVIYNYGEGSQNRYSKGFHIDVSSDGTNYTMVTNGVLSANTTAQTFDMQDIAGRYVKLVITNGYNSKAWELGEFQVFGTLFTDTTAPVPGTASSPATSSASPITVSYTGASDAGGSGLVSVELWYKKGAGGTWLNSGLTRLGSGSSGSFSFAGMTGNDTYYFGLVAVDGAGNRSASVSGSGDCSTVYTGPISLRNLVLPANGGVLRSYTSQSGSAHNAAKLNDGTTGSASYWMSGNTKKPQEFVYSFSNGNAAVLSHAILYNYGEGSKNRYSRGFHIDVSGDGVNYTVVTNGVLATNGAAQTFSLQGIAGKYVKLVITNGYSAGTWELSEFQVFGAFSSGPVAAGVPLAAPATLKAAGVQTQSAGTSAATEAVVSWPQVWSSSDWSAKCTAGNLVDGDTNTVWVGKADGSPWAVSVDFGKMMKLADLQVLFWDKAWKNTFVGGSVNGTTDWFDVMSNTNSTINVRYLLIEMWYDPAEKTPPAIREIIWK